MALPAYQPKSMIGGSNFTVNNLHLALTKSRSADGLYGLASRKMRSHSTYFGPPLRSKALGRRTNGIKSLSKVLLADALSRVDRAVYSYKRLFQLAAA